MPKGKSGWAGPSYVETNEKPQDADNASKLSDNAKA